MKRELAAFLHVLSARRPILIWFEDLHWADASTIDLMAYLCARLNELPLLLLVTYRQTELLISRHPFSTVRLDLEGRGLSREIPLPFLRCDDVRQYLDMEFPRNTFSPALAELIHAKTDGSPLFIVDSIEYLRATQHIVPTEAGWALAGSLPNFAHDLPRSVRSVIERKLDDTNRLLLQAAAVQGYDFDSIVVSDAAGIDASEAETRFEELARVHHLVWTIGEHRLPDGAFTPRYRFVHVLYQNVLYGQLTPTRRARTSLAVASALRRRHAGRPGIASSLARLFEAGGDPRHACYYFLLAARQAAGVFANHEVVALVECGLRLLPQLENAEERARRELELRMTMARVLMALHGFSAESVGDNFAGA